MLNVWAFTFCLGNPAPFAGLARLEPMLVWNDQTTGEVHLGGMATPSPNSLIGRIIRPVSPTLGFGSSAQTGDPE
jgi:hypothetical protein